MDSLKRMVALVPEEFQLELKRLHYRFQLWTGKFITFEPEFNMLHEWVNDGDWVIDIGANIGHYTIRLSELVGPQGRVIAFEPVPSTFANLTSNTRFSNHKNITLFNAAVSDKSTLVGMSIPNFSTGLKNYYKANISSAPEDSEESVLTLSIDSLKLDHRISLIKIDAESHEPIVFRGLYKIVKRDKPTLIIETVTDEIRNPLLGLGYTEEKLTDSPNVVFKVAR